MNEQRGSKRVRLLVLGTVAAVMLSLTSAAGAHQDQGTPSGFCSSGEVCLWDSTWDYNWYYYETWNYANHMTYYGSDEFFNYRYPYPVSGGEWSDGTASIVYNRGNQCTVYLREYWYFGGYAKPILKGWTVWLGGIYNNSASGNHWCTSS